MEVVSSNNKLANSKTCVLCIVTEKKEKTRFPFIIVCELRYGAFCFILFRLMSLYWFHCYFLTRFPSFAFLSLSLSGRTWNENCRTIAHDYLKCETPVVAFLLAQRRKKTETRRRRPRRSIAMICTFFDISNVMHTLCLWIFRWLDDIC